MQLKILTFAFDPDRGCFPPDPLEDVEGEVQSVVEHFFHQGGVPHLVLLVHYRPFREKARMPTRSGTDGIRAELSEPERPLYDRVRAWRNGRAQAEGVPPYVLLTNRQLAEMARRQPRTLSELGEVPGLGEAKLRRFGKELLQALLPPAAPDDTHAR